MRTKGGWPATTLRTQSAKSPFGAEGGEFPPRGRQCRLCSRGPAKNIGCAVPFNFSCTAARKSVRGAADAWCLAQTSRTGPKQLLRFEILCRGLELFRGKPTTSYAKLTQSLRVAYAKFQASPGRPGPPWSPWLALAALAALARPGRSGSPWPAMAARWALGLVSVRVDARVARWTLGGPP